MPRSCAQPLPSASESSLASLRILPGLAHPDPQPSSPSQTHRIAVARHEDVGRASSAAARRWWCPLSSPKGSPGLPMSSSSGPRELLEARARRFSPQTQKKSLRDRREDVGRRVRAARGRGWTHAGPGPGVRVGIHSMACRGCCVDCRALLGRSTHARSCGVPQSDTWQGGSFVWAAFCRVPAAWVLPVGGR